MNLYKFSAFVVGVLVCITRTDGETSTCLTVYKEGGAPAVFQSPKCPRWKLSNYASRPRTERCQTAMHQGRRKYQEDRTFCALDVRIPFPGLSGITEVTVGIVAVFDGHNGAEASEMASKLLLEYFMLHAYFLLDTTFSILLKNSVGRLPNKREQDLLYQALNWDEELDRHPLHHGRFKLTGTGTFDESFRLEILKKSLLRAIHDIDTTFTMEASRKYLDSGSTAMVILIAEGQILVANVGDSKALVCSENFQSPSEAKATLLRLYRQQRHNRATPIKGYNSFRLAASNGLAHFSAKDLTRDHHPDRHDERSRVESAGGYVLEWGGVSRVNGQLAVSRAIGDVSFKSYGVIPVPEVTDWQPLTVNDSYVVAASDGIFEKMSSQDVCDLLWELHSRGNGRSELVSSCSYSLADCIVKTAYEKGSMDNMAAIVVSFTSTGSSQISLQERFGGRGEVSLSALGLQEFNYEQPELEHAHPVMVKLDRLLVEGKKSSFGCFYLSENLNENVNYTFSVQKLDQQDMYDIPQALPEALDQCCGGHLNFYNDQNMCLHLGMTNNEGKDQCINPEGFASFLGFLESIPIHNIGSDYGSFEHATPDPRYILKKRFDRGSYGEVWLAFHWNCSEGSNASTWGKNKKKSFNNFNTCGRASQTNSSAHDCNASPPDDNLFILKRIMVEKGTTVYLSGLREKHFGEVFLNASSFLVGSLSAAISDSFLKESQPDFYDLSSKTNDTVVHEIGNTWNFENNFPNKNGLQRAMYEGGLNHIARYVESFESRSNEIWLVFRHEGMSLSKLLYTSEEMENDADEVNDEHVKRVQILRPSKWWHWLKTTEAGQEEMRNIIWQLLMALKSCHDRNIVHRDIKPENMVICFEDQDSGRCLKGSPTGDKKYSTKMRIIDFGSAMDDFTMKHLYGSVGPSRAEQTDEYTPPEAFLNASWYQGPASTVLKYDMWSVGVVILELILGSPDVFQINALTRALLDQHLQGWNEGFKELAYKLRSFMEMCILIPGSSSKHHPKYQGEASPASWKCSEEFFSHQIKSRDPLNIGFPNVRALRLVRQLLLWDPLLIMCQMTAAGGIVVRDHNGGISKEDRMSVDDALQHSYFQSPLQR